MHLVIRLQKKPQRRLDGSVILDQQQLPTSDGRLGLCGQIRHGVCGLDKNMRKALASAAAYDLAEVSLINNTGFCPYFTDAQALTLQISWGNTYVEMRIRERARTCPASEILFQFTLDCILARR